MVKTGQRYVSPGGAEMVVTKGGDGELTDGDVPLQPKGLEDAFQGAPPRPVTARRRGCPARARSR